MIREVTKPKALRTCNALRVHVLQAIPVSVLFRSTCSRKRSTHSENNSLWRTRKKQNSPLRRDFFVKYLKFCVSFERITAQIKTLKLITLDVTIIQWISYDLTEFHVFSSKMLMDITGMRFSVMHERHVFRTTSGSAPVNISEDSK